MAKEMNGTVKSRTTGAGLAVKRASGSTHANGAAAQDLEAQLAALNRTQAVIEFTLDGTIVTANGNFLGVMGYTLDEIQGKHHSIFVDSEYVKSAEYKQFWASLATGKAQQAEYKRFGKNGKEVWIQASYNPVVDGAGNVLRVVKYATDVTAAKLRNADYEGQIAAIGRSQAVIEFDLAGKILNANDNFLNTMGYRLDEVRGRHHSIFVTSVFRCELGIQAVLGRSSPRRVPARRIQAHRQRAGRKS